MENSRNTTTAIVAYVLMGFGWLLGGLGYVAALILAHIEYSAVKDKDALLADHFRYLKRTGWYGLLWTVISMVTAALIVGYLTAVLTIIWVVYRSIKGFSHLQRGEFLYPQKPVATLEHSADAL